MKKTLKAKCICGLKEHIQKMIDKCKEQLELIENGTYPQPPNAKANEDLWDGILEERHAYLEGLQSKLQFMLDYPEREQIV